MDKTKQKEQEKLGGIVSEQSNIVPEEPVDGCTCDDPRKMTPCPVHEKTGSFLQGDLSGPSPTMVTVTVDHRMDRDSVGNLLYKETTHTGVGFICPWCKERSLLDFYKGCPSCLSPVEFK